MKKITELFVLLEDKPGTIYELTRALKKKNINIEAVGLFIDSARLLVDRPAEAQKTLQENGYQADLREVLSVDLPNRQGALMEVTQKLSNAGINVIYLYGAMLAGQKSGLIILEVDNMQLALDVFANHRF
jgi:hypothetical protein